MSFTYRIEIEDGNPLVWIEKDGYPVIRQPHHPNAYMLAPWDSVEEAESWAQSEVENMTANASAPPVPVQDLAAELAALRAIVEEMQGSTGPKE